jgi:hypothetical protein
MRPAACRFLRHHGNTAAKRRRESKGSHIQVLSARHGNVALTCANARVFVGSVFEVFRRWTHVQVVSVIRGARGPSAANARDLRKRVALPASAIQAGEVRAALGRGNPTVHVCQRRRFEGVRPANRRLYVIRLGIHVLAPMVLY